MTELSLSPRALYVEVAELLRERIFSRELVPGSWIDELKLAEEYGISRTPLREALKVLATEGLVTMKVRRGAYVTEVSERDLADVYHLLALLESDAASVVATQASALELSELQALHNELEKAAADRERFFETGPLWPRLSREMPRHQCRPCKRISRVGLKLQPENASVLSPRCGQIKNAGLSGHGLLSAMGQPHHLAGMQGFQLVVAPNLTPAPCTRQSVA